MRDTGDAGTRKPTIIAIESVVGERAAAVINFFAKFITAPTRIIEVALGGCGVASADQGVYWGRRSTRPPGCLPLVEVRSLAARPLSFPSSHNYLPLDM